MTEIPNWVLYFNVAKDVIITIIAGIGLIAILYAKKQIDLIKNQTKETRHQFRIKNERESISLAVELSEKFPNIIQRFGITYSKNEQNFAKLEKLKKHYVNQIIKDKNCRNIIPEKLFEQLIDLLNPVGNELLQLNNELEGIALYFVNGVADENAVFTSLAPTYCEMIETSYALMIVNRCVCCGDCDNKYSKSKYELFNNSFKLYIIWKSRLLKEKNKMRIDEFSSKQKELDLKSQPVKIIGEKTL